MAQWSFIPDCANEMDLDQRKGHHRDRILGRLFQYLQRVASRLPKQHPLHQITTNPQIPIFIYSKTIGLLNINVFHFAASTNTRLGLKWTPELASLTALEEQTLLAEALKRLSDPSSPPML
jgi:hypothetical protein